MKLERLSARYSDLEQQHDALQSLVQTYKDECGRLRNAITCNGTASSALQAKVGQLSGATYLESCLRGIGSLKMLKDESRRSPPPKAKPSTCGSNAIALRGNSMTCKEPDR